MRLVTVVVTMLLACNGTPPMPTGTGSATRGSATPGSAAPARCQSAHDCTLRSVCGCSCAAVPISQRAVEVCEEACPNPEVCKGYSLICDLPTGRCGAIPLSP